MFSLLLNFQLIFAQNQADENWTGMGKSRFMDEKIFEIFLNFLCPLLGETTFVSCFNFPS